MIFITGDMHGLMERFQDSAFRHIKKGDTLIICGDFGFLWEGTEEEKKALKKLEKKNLDMIVANNLKVPGAGFGVDTNVVTIITAQGATELPLQSKDAVAGHIADAIAGK